MKVLIALFLGAALLGACGAPAQPTPTPPAGHHYEERCRDDYYWTVQCMSYDGGKTQTCTPQMVWYRPCSTVLVPNN